MASHHAYGPGRALYRVFVAPAISSARPVLARPAFPISKPPVRHLRQETAAPRPEVIDRKKWDEEIESRLVFIVGDDGRLGSEPRTRFDILNRIDRKTQRLVQMSEDAPKETDSIPICKIMTKEEIFKTEERKKKQLKERKKISKLVTEMKSLELNWAIDRNDLGHRMDKMKGFLAEGRRVEIVLAAKKRGRKASKEECGAVLEEIKTAAESVPGATQFKPLEGSLGAFSTLVWQGKAPDMSKTAKEQALTEDTSPQAPKPAAANG